MPMAVLLILIGALLATAVLAVAVQRLRAATPFVYGLTLATTLALAALAVARLVGGPGAVDSVVLPIGLPWLGAHFHIDALSAFFLLVVNLSGAAASLYGLGYGRHEPSPARVLPFFPAFIAGMDCVLVADDAFTFLLSWEFMSLASWALVMAHHRDEENRRAAYVYILMASGGMLALLLAFGVLAGPDGGYGFDAIRADHLTPVMSAVVLALAVIGAGSKAGLVPLHVWLPLAHPAAPSHVSALMSGAMTKVAVYGFIRIVFDLAGPAEWWWSPAVLALGGITAVVGVLTALMQDDLKRVLAYSTIENIGVIFVGLGLALAFRAEGMHAAAALAMTAALFHVFNHALFKNLLFFGAGAVLTATGERRMDRLGGLIRLMPQTSLAVLVGCAAISALPPLNGFASEWLLLQAILLSPDLPAWSLKLLVPAVGALLALAAAFAAACFVRFFGVVFLGRARSAPAAAAHEVDRYSLSAMLALAALCLVAGVVPGIFIDALAPAVSQTIGATMPEQSALPWLTTVPIAESRSSYNGLLVFFFIVASAAIAAFAIHRFASRTLRRAPAWDCGFPDPTPLTQYTGGSFSQPIRRIFAAAFNASEEVHMPAPGDIRPARFTLVFHDLAWDTFYRPVAAGVSVIADRFNSFQFQTIRRYLSLVFLALVGLLLVLAVSQ